MKKILLALMVCMAVSFVMPPAAHALEESDIVGKDIAMLVRGTFIESSLYKGQYSGKIEKRDGKLYITNFLGFCDVECYITEEGNLAIPTGYEGSKNGVKYEFRRYGGGLLQEENGNITVYQLGKWPNYQYIELFGYWVPDDSDIILTSQNSDGKGLDFWCNQGIGVYEDNNDVYDAFHYNGMRAVIAEYNAVATEFELNSSEYEAIRQYNANVSVSNGEIRIVNWKNRGFLYSSNTSLDNPSNEVYPLTGSVDASGNVTIPKQEVGVNSSFTYNPYYTGFGTWGGMYGYWYAFVLDDDWNPKRSFYKMYTQGSSSDTTITGTYKENEVSHSKTGDTNMWSTNGGDLKTFESATLTLNEDGIYSTYNNAVQNGSHADKTVYLINGNEVTHDAQLKVSGVYYNEENPSQIRVIGKISDRLNNQHHESYDLYIVEGNHYNINNTETTPHATDGLQGARCIVRGLVPDVAETYNLDNENGMERAASDGNVTFDETVDWPEGLEPNKSSYTLFLKANYNKSHLEPTFLAMATPDIITSVDFIGDDVKNIDVRAVEGGVMIEGFDGMIEIYTVAGQQVFAGYADGFVNLDGGLYIVRTGTKSAKVIVR